MQSSIWNADSEYQRRVEMVQITIPPLVDIIVSYCVTRYYLFEESLVLYWDLHRTDETLLNIHAEFVKLQEQRHPMILQYAAEMQRFIRETDKQLQLRLAMSMNVHHPLVLNCQRLACYFNGCCCYRSLLYASLHTGRLVNSF